MSLDVEAGGGAPGRANGPSPEEPEHPEAIGLRDFLIATADHLDPEYRIGRVHLESGEVCGVIAVAIADGKLVVAVPEGVWHRVVARRLLPQRALTKPLLCAVAACHQDQRDTLIEDDSVVCRVWSGLASREFEASLDFISEDQIDFGFSPSDLEPLLPFGKALVEVSQTHFGFFTAESEAVPECPTPFPGGQEARIQSLENTLGRIQASLQLLTGENAQPEPVAPTPKRKSALRKSGTKEDGAERASSSQKPGNIPGLDRESVAAALAAGIPLHHLQEMGNVLSKRPNRLEEMPRGRRTSRTQLGPLSESDEEEELLEAEGDGDGSGDPEAGGADFKKAIVQLTAIANRLAPKEKKDKIESILDGGSGSALHSESSSSSSGSRKNSVAMRLLQRTLIEDPRYIYQTVEANMQSDFLSRPVPPGEPMTNGTTVRGWLASRSRVQLFHNHVRWCWQVAGIWDALIAQRPEEARARCALLLGAAEQASIDGGNWVVSNVALLEQPPPYQAFAHHQMPTALELQHSSLYDPRWAEIFLGHLKEVDSFVDAKKKLSSSQKSNREKESGENPWPKPKPKAKGKGDREKGKKGGEAAVPSEGGSGGN